MAYFDYDLCLVGGGLSSALLAYRLKTAQPRLRLVVIEKGQVLGGTHTWSFHTSDVSKQALSWLGPFVTKYWHEHQICFPDFERRIASGYHSIRSEQLHRVVGEKLGSSLLLGHEVTGLAPHELTLADGCRLTARAVIDGRGFVPPAKGAVGYQKFFGLDLELEEKHGLGAPILMDATCEQVDGFRFFYCLPWSERRLLVEDTRYSDGPELDRQEYRRQILSYARRRGWKVRAELREESGSLPLPLAASFTGDGDPPARMRSTGLAAIGVRAGLFHSTTGYSLPDAVRLADALATCTEWGSPALLRYLIIRSETHLRRQRFYRLLNRMLFLGSAPQRRFEILQRFYRLPEGVVRRFYAAELGAGDCLRLLFGRPPIPLAAAWRCLFETGERALA